MPLSDIRLLSTCRARLRTAVGGVASFRWPKSWRTNCCVSRFGPICRWPKSSTFAIRFDVFLRFGRRQRASRCVSNLNNKEFYFIARIVNEPVSLTGTDDSDSSWIEPSFVSVNSDEGPSRNDDVDFVVSDVTMHPDRTAWWNYREIDKIDKRRKLRQVQHPAQFK